LSLPQSLSEMQNGSENVSRSLVGGILITGMDELNVLQIARLYYRLCSFDQAVPLLLSGLEKAKQHKNWNEYGEIIALLMRIWAERLEFDTVTTYLAELESLKAVEAPSRLSYALGVLSSYRGQGEEADRQFSLAVQNAKNSHDKGYGLFGMTHCRVQRGELAESMATIELLQGTEFQEFPDLVVATLILEAVIHRKQKRYDRALDCLARSQMHCQKESNVYMALNTLFGLASIYVEMKEIQKAKEHLNLLNQLVSAKDLTHLSQQVQKKRDELAEIESSGNEIRLVEGPERLLFTPDGEKVDLKKQFVLVNLLKLLGEKGDQGVTKEEMVIRLWREDYHPLRHDNKVHATILRLRKLIEPDLKAPQFILNSPDGYQLNPKITFTVQGGVT